jgi:putative nucleotidyltransferase with HDIG domain
MKTESTFLHSKLARRILWLFVLSSLIPMTALALISLRNVTAQLHEQSRQLLHQVSRDEAMSILERAHYLEGAMGLAASSIREISSESAAQLLASSNGPDSTIVKQFEGLMLVSPDGNCKPFIGNCKALPGYTRGEQESLKSGESDFSTVACNRPEPCIFLSRELDSKYPQEGILVADIEDSYLWGAETIRQDIDLCVLDQNGSSLFCSAESPSTYPSQVSRTNSGEFEWQRNGQEYLANFWNFPLSTLQSGPRWTVVASQNKLLELAPLARFRTSFLLVFLLTLWMVLLLSLVQIRRNLDPLKKLMESTREISEGNFQTRVNVKSGDEFGELADSFNSMTHRIEKQLHSLKVVNEIDRAILSSWDIERIVDVLSRRIGELIPHDFLGVSLFESSGFGPALMYIYGRGADFKRQAKTIEVTAKELQELADQGQISVVGVGQSNDLPSYLEPLRERGMAYYLRVPILLEGRASAVFILGHASSPVWTEEDKEQACQLANQFAVAQANSRLISDLQQLSWGAMMALARAIDAKSPWTMGHSERVTDLAIKTAKAMGLPPRELDIIRRGGLLHDIGKIGTPAEILDKPGKLTDEELTVMREHVNIGARILEPIPGLVDSMHIVLQHHEWVNGGGYPRGLAGEEVTLHARIFAVADCFDALISDRPYRKGLPVKRILQILQEGAGKQFDPHVLEIFRTVVESDVNTREREEIQGVGVEVNLLRD